MMSMMLIAFSTLVSGCGTSGQLPVVELSASAIAPVGEVVPVFVEQRCRADCGIQDFGLTRRKIAARTESGAYVQPISIDAAAELAGGAGKLLEAANSKEGNPFFLTRKGFSAVYQSGLGPGGAALIPFVVGYTAYSAFHPEMVELQRVEEISIPDTREPRHDSGWIFLPLADYTEVRTSFDWMTSLATDSERSEILTCPWNGSSITPASASEPPKALTTD